MKEVISGYEPFGKILTYTLLNKESASQIAEHIQFLLGKRILNMVYPTWDCAISSGTYIAEVLCGKGNEQIAMELTDIILEYNKDEMERKQIRCYDVVNQNKIDNESSGIGKIYFDSNAFEYCSKDPEHRVLQNGKFLCVCKEDECLKIWIMKIH